MRKLQPYGAAQCLVCIAARLTSKYLIVEKSVTKQATRQSTRDPEALSTRIRYSALGRPFSRLK